MSIENWANKYKGGQGSSYSQGGGSTEGLGGFSPSQKLQDTYSAITSGSYLQNPYDESTQNKEWADWNNTRNQYGNNYGFKYIADQGFNDDELTWIKRQIDNNSQLSASDASGNRQRISDLFDQFYFGKQTGVDEAGNPVYGGGYKDTLAEASMTPSQKAFEDMTDNEKIKADAENVYRGKTRMYNEQFRALKEQYPDADYSSFMNEMLKRDNEFRTAKESYEQAVKDVEADNYMNPSSDDSIRAAMESSQKAAQDKKNQSVQELELALGMAYSPEEQAEYMSKLYEATGDDKYKPYYKPNVVTTDAGTLDAAKKHGFKQGTKEFDDFIALSEDAKSQGFQPGTDAYEMYINLRLNTKNMG